MRFINLLPTNIYTNQDKDYLFCINAAGRTKDEIDIQFDGHTLRVEFSGLPSELKLSEEWKRVERGYGYPTKKEFGVFEFPEEMKPDVKAELENGILKIQVFALEKNKPKKISIQIPEKTDQTVR